MSDFEGDLKLINTPDGGVVIEKDGLFLCDISCETAVYVSLFGGSELKQEWWGNVISGTCGNEKLQSEFNRVIKTMPMSIKNIRLAEEAAGRDLNWFIQEKIATEIETILQQTGSKQCVLYVKIINKDTGGFYNSFDFTWEGV